MIYLSLHSLLPINYGGLKATIRESTFNVETTLGGELQHPQDADQSFDRVGPYLDGFEPDVLQQMKVNGVGVQLVVPISTTINDFLESCLPICDEFIEYTVGFEKKGISNLFFSSCKKQFPHYQRKKNDLPISRYVEVHFNILNPEVVYGMEVYANYLRSPRFWADLYGHLIDHLQSIESHDILVFDTIRREIINGIRERMIQLQLH